MVPAARLEYGLGSMAVCLNVARLPSSTQPSTATVMQQGHSKYLLPLKMKTAFAFDS